MSLYVGISSVSFKKRKLAGKNLAKLRKLKSTIGKTGTESGKTGQKEDTEKDEERYGRWRRSITS